MDQGPGEAAAVNDGFNKLFSSIVTSTIWQEPDHTRLAWITLLAIADKHGEVAGSIPGLANIANIPVESFRKAIEVLMSPDPDSRTELYEGRRIEKIDGGFRLLNHGKYRAILSKEATRASKAAYMRAQRERERAERGDTVEESGKSGQPKQRQRQKQKQKATPCSPPPGDDTAGAAVPRETRAQAIRFDKFIESLAGAQAISKDDPIFEYAKNAAIPRAYISLAWFAFRQYHLDRPDKRQLDWRAVFRNYVRENYLKLWRTTAEGGYELTDRGEQQQRAYAAARAERDNG